MAAKLSTMRRVRANGTSMCVTVPPESKLHIGDWVEVLVKDHGIDVRLLKAKEVKEAKAKAENKKPVKKVRLPRKPSKRVYPKKQKKQKKQKTKKVKFSLLGEE